MLLFILLVASLVGTIFTNPIDSTLKPFELSEFLSGSFKNLGWNGTWISDDTFIIKTVDGHINKVNAADLIQEQFLEATIFDNYNGSNISLSPDQRYVLIKYNTKSVFRHSATSQYTVYDTETKIYYDIASKKHIQYAMWGPVNSALAYVDENNIYYLPTPKSNLAAIQITKDGIPGIVYNGVPDWVYEEEVLGSGHALWFSPDGSRLAFASFNDKKVKEFQYYMYGSPGNVDNQYPQVVKLRYPKVGTRNPTVVIKHVDLIDPVINILPGIIPQEIVSADYVLTGITWATNTDVVAVVQNRVQNIAAITRCDVTLNSCKVENEFKETKGWLQVQPPRYNKDGTKSLLLISQKEGNGTFKHLVLFDIATEKATRLTFGKRVVLSILRWDEQNNLVYYSSTIEGHPSHQHTHIVNINTLKDKCLTCNFETPEGLCKVAVTQFSKKSSYYSKVCNGPGPTLIQIENLVAPNVLIWEDNLALRTKLKTKIQPVIKDLKVPLPSGFIARARLWLPPEYNTSNKKYPLIVDVYGGPNSNRISNSFTTGVVNYFTTNRKYIYAQIDGRGSGRNGDDLMFQVYKRLGTVEIEDQIDVATYLKDNFPFIDGEKMGIWGWSYGGFATIWALIKDKENIFKFGLAVAPVTNFIFYDTIYTERYMGLPTEEDNVLGYNNTDVTHHVESLRHKTLFLIHGNADDNVHYQQSMHLAKALETADIMFYQQSYPDENHALKGVSPHLYHTIDNFFAQEFGKK